MNAPVLVLSDSFKRESETKVHHVNIQASKGVADITRTTLDPTLALLQHANGENAWTFIDGNSGAIADMKASKIWDAYNVKAQTFKTAIEAACMLLRIDDRVSGIKKKQAPGAGPLINLKPTIETERDADNDQILPD